jgi:hypothetical protein
VGLALFCRIPRGAHPLSPPAAPPESKQTQILRRKMAEIVGKVVSLILETSERAENGEIARNSGAFTPGQTFLARHHFRKTKNNMEKR